MRADVAFSPLRPVGVGTKCQILTTRLANRTLHARLGGPVSRPLFALSSLVPHREDCDVAWVGPSTGDHFCGSKAGATFRLATFFNQQRLEDPRIATLSQQLNLTLEMENGALADFLG